MATLKDSLTEHFIILSKKIIAQRGLTLEVNCENDYRNLLSTGINKSIGQKQFINPSDEKDFFSGKEYYQIESNILQFVNSWINDALLNNETTLHESTLMRIKTWMNNNLCPGFIPFC